MGGVDPTHAIRLHEWGNRGLVVVRIKEKTKHGGSGPGSAQNDGRDGSAQNDVRGEREINVPTITA